MNEWAHRLSILSALAHLAIGVPELLSIGPRFLPASWALLQGWLGSLYWLWPASYVLTGLVATVGIWSVPALRAGFLLSAGIYFIWGSCSIQGWIWQTGGTIPGSVSFWLLSGTFAVLARYVKSGEQVQSMANHWTDEVETARQKQRERHA